MDPMTRNRDEEMRLLSQPGNGDRSWRLNFEGFHLPAEHGQKKPDSTTTAAAF
ncbi:hypothetical protein SAY86_014210 [Trapa natans]|uniref:Uncharacterized protein n=1 Tax=Trapa natans TaxID=22666 RepID=A0AAN7KYQ6_TRANT|nr:hypothetical protein SAY86_014210 [Trapa natans]